MAFITNLDDRESNNRLLRMVRHIDAEAATAAGAIQRQGLDNVAGVRNVTLTKGYQQVDLWYEAKVRSLLKAGDKAARDVSNRARWQLLTAKNDHVRTTIAAARERLIVMQASGSAFYVSLLKALTLQAMCRLLEPRVQLVSRRGDVRLIEPLLPEIESEYGRLTGGLRVRITVDHKVHLPDDRVGGVMVGARNRTVFVDNTLAVRFRLRTDEYRLPFLWARLFGDGRGRRGDGDSGYGKRDRNNGDGDGNYDCGDDGYGDGGDGYGDD